MGEEESVGKKHNNYYDSTLCMSSISCLLLFNNFGEFDCSPQMLPIRTLLPIRTCKYA